MQRLQVALEKQQKDAANLLGPKPSKPGADRANRADTQKAKRANMSDEQKAEVAAKKADYGRKRRPRSPGGSLAL